jgi:hypothetical protein
LAALAALWFAQQLALGATVGQRVWKLRMLDERGRAPRRRGLGRRFFQVEALDPAARLGAALSTLALLGGSLWAIDRLWLDHPVLRRAAIWELEPFAPAPADANWQVQSWFYAVGAWPRTYRGQPVLHELPYEKGPPKQFVGHVTARWEMPDAKVIYEGPRTPAEVSVATLRDCLTGSWLSARAGALRCLRLREAVLLRHVREIRQAVDSGAAGGEWQLRWFEIKNPALPPEESPIGLYLTGQGPLRAQDRFIAVNARGANQAFILDRSLTPAGLQARAAFEQAMRSQRISPELNAGRAWVDRGLASTRIADLKNPDPQDPAAFIARIADVHTLLISKISVNPGTYEAYFHLAGTSLLLARQATQMGRADWTAIAKPLVNSAFRFARDIGPDDPRTAQLQNIRLDAQDF